MTASTPETHRSFPIRNSQSPSTLPACSMYVTCGGCCAPSATIARLSPPSRTESPSMNQEEQVPQARPPAAPVDAEETPVQKLERLGIRGILWQLARDGQLIDVRCEMPQCYCFRGRRYFDPRSARSDWEPTADHYPRLKMHGGHLTPDNVRLAYRLCNRYASRTLSG